MTALSAVIHDGAVTHVLVPFEHFRKLTEALAARARGGRPELRELIDEAQAILENAPASRIPAAPSPGLRAEAERMREAVDTLTPDDASFVRDALDQLLAAPPTEFRESSSAMRDIAARRLVATRKLAGLSQKELAAKVGMTQSQLSRIEKHPERASVGQLQRLAAALGVDAAAILP